jgi:hypothetical protein
MCEQKDKLDYAVNASIGGACFTMFYGMCCQASNMMSPVYSTNYTKYGTKLGRTHSERLAAC